MIRRLISPLGGLGGERKTEKREREREREREKWQNGEERVHHLQKKASNFFIKFSGAVAFPESVHTHFPNFSISAEFSLLSLALCVG